MKSTYANGPRGMLFRIVLLAFVSLVSNICFAATHYVRAGASGGGTTWADAYGSLPTTLIRGDVYFVGAGAYGSRTFRDSGTELITVLHPTTASHGTDTGWNDTYAGQAVWTDMTFGQGNYLIDGVTGGGPGSWGTGFGFKIQMPSSGGQSHAVGYDGNGTMSNITLRHTDIQGRGRAYTGGDTDLIYLLNAYNGLTISRCYLHDTDRTMILTWPSAGTGMTIEYSYFARNGIAEHREAWSSGSDSNVIVRYNLFEDILGTGFIASVNGNGTANNWNIYGNVFYWTGNYSDGLINTGIFVTRYDGGTCSSPAICVLATNWHIYNNVIANIGAGSFTSALDLEGPISNVVVENNIWYNNRTSGSSGAGQATTADYNWFFGNTRNNTSGPHDVIGTGNPFVNWQAGDWSLVAAIPGLPLAAPFNLDALGIGPAGGGIWNRGAYQFNATSASRPAPPQNLTATVTTR